MKYNLSSRIIHWLMAFLIIGELFLGIYMHDFVAKDATYKYTLYDIHKSFGVLLFILVVIRIINRLKFNAPALPPSIKIIEQRLAEFGHLFLYILMFLVPTSGYLMSSFAGYPVKFFGLIVPSIVEVNYKFAKISSEFHEIGAYSLMTIIVIHILAVIKHRFFDKPENDVLKRMI